MDKNGYFDALIAFSANQTKEIPVILEQYLDQVARNGETLFHWPVLKPLIFAKMEQVMEDLRKGLGSETIPVRPNVENVPFSVMQLRIKEALQKFNGAPFTIQRLCELLIDPRKHYKRSDKFLRGLEKNVLVVSTVDPFGRKVISETGEKPLVNGMDTNGSPFLPRDPGIAAHLPPVPGWVTTVTPDLKTASTSQQKQPQFSSQDQSVSPCSESQQTSSSKKPGQVMVADQEEVVEEETVVEAGEALPFPGLSDELESEMSEEGEDDTKTGTSSSSPSELSTSDEDGSSSPTSMAHSDDSSVNSSDSGDRGFQGRTSSDARMDVTSVSSVVTEKLSEPEVGSVGSPESRSGSLESVVSSSQEDQVEEESEGQAEVSSSGSNLDLSGSNLDLCPPAGSALNDSSGFETSSAPEFDQQNLAAVEEPDRHRLETSDLVTLTSESMEVAETDSAQSNQIVTDVTPADPDMDHVSSFGDSDHVEDVTDELRISELQDNRFSFSSSSSPTRENVSSSSHSDRVPSAASCTHKLSPALHPDEPEAKRRKLSAQDESVQFTSETLHGSDAILSDVRSPGSSTTKEVRQQGDTQSDSTQSCALLSSRCQGIESESSLSGREEDMETAELDSAEERQICREGVGSPPTHLTSSSDSQGFEVSEEERQDADGSQLATCNMVESEAREINGEASENGGAAKVNDVELNVNDSEASEKDSEVNVNDSEASEKDSEVNEKCGEGIDKDSEPQESKSDKVEENTSQDLSVSESDDISDQQ